MTIESLIQDLFDLHLDLHFPGGESTPLPTFTVDVTGNKEVVVFAGSLSQTDAGRLWKALELFSNHIGKTVIFRNERISPAPFYATAVAL